MVEQHEHREYAPMQDLNGLGRKLTEGTHKFGERVAVQEAKTGRNESDIQTILTLVGENAKAIGAVEKSVAGLVGKVAGVVAAISFFTPILIKLGEHFLNK